MTLVYVQNVQMSTKFTTKNVNNFLLFFSHNVRQLLPAAPRDPDREGSRSEIGDTDPSTLSEVVRGQCEVHECSQAIQEDDLFLNSDGAAKIKHDLR